MEWSQIHLGEYEGKNMGMKKPGLRLNDNSSGNTCTRSQRLLPLVPRPDSTMVGTDRSEPDPSPWIIGGECSIHRDEAQNSGADSPASENDVETISGDAMCRALRSATRSTQRPVQERKLPTPPLVGGHGKHRSRLNRTRDVSTEVNNSAHDSHPVLSK